MISFAYAVHIQAWPLLIGQGMPIPIYARNLYMIYRDRGAAGGLTKLSHSRAAAVHFLPQYGTS